MCEEGPHPIGEGVNFHVHEHKVYCPEHFDELFLHRCSGCNLGIKGRYLQVLEDYYHPGCWTCTGCKQEISADNSQQCNGHFYCKPCAVQARARGSSRQGQSTAVQAIAKPDDSTRQLHHAAGAEKKDIEPKVAAPAEAVTEVASAPSADGQIYLSYIALKSNNFDRHLVDSKVRVWRGCARKSALLVTTTSANTTTTITTITYHYHYHHHHHHCYHHHHHFPDQGNVPH